MNTLDDSRCGSTRLLATVCVIRIFFWLLVWMLGAGFMAMTQLGLLLFLKKIAMRLQSIQICTDTKFGS